MSPCTSERVNKNKKTSPNEKTSDLNISKVIGELVIETYNISGEKNGMVPYILLVEESAGLYANYAEPTSTSFQYPSYEYIIFYGLISLCATPSYYKYIIPSITSKNT